MLTLLKNCRVIFIFLKNMDVLKTITTGRNDEHFNKIIEHWQFLLQWTVKIITRNIFTAKRYIVIVFVHVIYPAAVKQKIMWTSYIKLRKSLLFCQKYIRVENKNKLLLYCLNISFTALTKEYRVELQLCQLLLSISLQIRHLVQVTYFIIFFSSHS